MRSERFSLFNYKISFIYKCIKALEADAAVRLGVKGVHLFWIYSLVDHPEGLSASEIAKKNGINRSLVSREIQKLSRENMVYFAPADSGAHYNARILLTEKGRAAANEIYRIGMRVQEATGKGLDEAELSGFYESLDRIADNLGRIAVQKKL